MESSDREPDVVWVDHEDVPNQIRLILLACFAIFFAFLSPIYLVNRLNFVRRVRRRPLASSWLVQAQARWPLLYEVAMLFQNFPLYDRIYGAIPTPAGRVLQVGCGTGLFNRYLRHKSDFKLYNLEPNASSIALARRLGRLDNAICGSITDRLPFADGCFDQIIFARSLHHIHRPGKAFRECLRLLGCNGSIIVFDPVIEDGYEASPEAWVGNSSIDGVIWRYTASSLVRLLNRTLPEGLTVTRVETKRMPHLTNFNLVIPQTDAIITIKKRTYIDEATNSRADRAG